MKVFSIGGSILADNLEQLDRLAEAFEDDEEYVVVTGAGPLARYIDASSGNEGEKDLIGIRATRLHAKTLATEIKGACPKIPETPEELSELASRHQVTVSGGFVPGYSTDAVAATAAELLEAELVIATTIDGVYTADPEKEDSRKLDEVSVEQLRELVAGNSQAGGYELIDEVAISIIERSEIPTKVMRGSLANLSRPEEADGTHVTS